MKLRGIDGENKGGRPAGDEYDEEAWQLESKRADYQVDRLYTKSTNKHDHSVRTDVRIPPGIHATVAEIVSRVPGYRSMADFYRDAVVHRMHWWMDRNLELTPELQHQKNMELWLADLDATKVMMDLTESLLTMNREILDRAERTKDQWILGKTIRAIEEKAEELGEPYLGQLRVLASEYRKKLKGMS